MSHRAQPKPSGRVHGVFFLCAVGVAAGFFGGAGCRRNDAAGPGGGVRTVAAAVAQTSQTCQSCHAAEFSAWVGTDHALANRPLDAQRDQAAFTGGTQAAEGGSRFDLSWCEGRAVMTERRDDGRLITHEPGLILGSKPLWQPLLPAPGNRWQPTDMAYDLAKKEWFNVFGDEGRKPGEWGHWTGRGMNWNSMCAQCHMTGLQKNYDAPTDSYHSSWVEHGVGCIQCHGPVAPGHTNPGYKTPPAAAPGRQALAMQTCAPCHARNEPLTADFQPWDNYHDHYRITLPVDPAVYYPDGQQRDEDFNWTSVLLSRMGHAGVTCMDCHDPHSTKTILPAGDNQLCMQCHAAPGRVMAGGARAVPIDPLAHSHHQPGSTGNQCVTCHLPTTNYMQRAPRHDHGWLKPDPLLTKELGIPNACNRCHADQTTDWAIQAAEAWYGPKLENAQRIRTRAVAAALLPPTA
jgi:predicted CXXCH cytochrome family protein